MRLVTIYADEIGVRRQLDRVHDDLVAALDRVTGRSEWGVKVYARPGDAPAAPAARETSGAAYLQRKREAAQARRAADERVEDVARELHEALSSATVAARAEARGVRFMGLPVALVGCRRPPVPRGRPYPAGAAVRSALMRASRETARPLGAVVSHAPAAWSRSDGESGTRGEAVSSNAVAINESIATSGWKVYSAKGRPGAGACQTASGQYI